MITPSRYGERRAKMGELHLTALNGGNGDAFLLQDDGCNYLIDGGNRTAILRDIPKNIKTVIVTHNDMDHCRGIISMLEDGNFNIAEIWLPGHWQPVLSFIRDICYDSDTITKGDMCRIGTDELSPDDLLKNTEDDIGEVSTLIEDIDHVIDNKTLYIIDGKYTYIKLYESASESDEFILAFIKNLMMPGIPPEQLIRLNNIIRIATLAFQNGIEIKWFYPKDRHKEIEVGNFVAMNSEPMFSMKKLKRNDFFSFCQLCMLTVENKYSLVFLYKKDDFPKVLFTADSDLSFCKQNICYKNQIVVTAPHHGSNNEKNERVYDKIECADAIYLKSGRIKKVSEKFEKRDKKVCNNCKQYNLGYQEAKLIHKENTWIISSGYVCIKGIHP
jgi:hypothetical protein